MVAAIKSQQNNKHLGFSQNTQNKQKNPQQWIVWLGGRKIVGLVLATREEGEKAGYTRLNARKS